MTGSTARRPGGRILAAIALYCLAATVSAAEGGILHLYTWADFFSPRVLESFEERHGCVVAIDVFDSNEDMLEEIAANGGDYDVVTPSAYMVEEMRRRALLLPVDHALIPNLAGIDPDIRHFTEDPDMAYSVPYARTVTGIGYNRRELGPIGTPEQSWSLFARRDLAKRVTLLNDMRETIGAALKFLGHSLNTTDDGQLEAAGRLLGEWRGNLAGFEVEAAGIGLGFGEYAAVQGYNGDLAVLMAGNGDIDFFVPREGSAVTTDHFVILADSEKSALAHAFINHVLDVENAAMNMTDILYYMPIPAAVDRLPPDIRNNHAFTVPDDVMEKCEIIRDLGEDNVKYEKVWDAITR